MLTPNSLPTVRNHSNMFPISSAFPWENKIVVVDWLSIWKAAILFPLEVLSDIMGLREYEYVSCGGWKTIEFRLFPMCVLKCSSKTDGLTGTINRSN